jgi:DNA-binding MarR family transcriptional regulator
MNIETSVTYAFTRVTNNFRHNFELKMNEIDLHGGQVFILVSLWNNDQQSQIDLATNLNLSAPTIFKMVNSLIKRGFVECFKCKKDGRMMRVHLTQKGIEYQKLVEEKYTEFETDFFSTLTETEKLIFTQICGKLKDNLHTKVMSDRTA